ncbi:hypothetical protein [Tenacibaculum larymnensis]|uniref:Uncharacterized protein n=1 Tax=Tenacibaculum larymnensis TaxID=2878201 RepID=A0A9X4IQI5_9FLAO|nr:hypothetical protein [Tenacibaculum larymnensis]MDE1206967.1 hypothetical protein [Tenacibaculum larymnensis]
MKIEDNRSEAVAQRKLEEAVSYSTQKQTPFIQFKKLGVMQLGRKRKGKGKFSTVGASPAASAVTNMFIQQHIGNQVAARQMAQNRAGTGIAASHTIDISETAKLLSEMQQRINSGYYIPGNQVMSPYAGGMQYLTANSYKIWETSFDKKGRLKKTKMIHKKFYYDVLGMAGNALHHFDGPA